MQPRAGETVVMAVKDQDRSIRQDLQKTIREIQADVQRDIARDARAGQKRRLRRHNPPRRPGRNTLS